MNISPRDAEKLVELAIALDAVRLLANDCPPAAPQTGVYGHVSTALVETLTLLTDKRRAERMYQFLLDGGTVADAIEWDADQPPEDVVEEIMKLIHPNPWELAEIRSNRDAWDREREYMTPDHVNEIRGFDDER